jgi:hypothetical protein
MGGYGVLFSGKTGYELSANISSYLFFAIIMACPSFVFGKTYKVNKCSRNSYNADNVSQYGTP